MVVINPKLVSDSLDYRQGLSNKEKTALKKNFGRLWEVMAAGILIPARSFEARTFNFEYLPKDKKDLSLFGEWLHLFFRFLLHLILPL